jgi:AcrR family transcriptional regulator
VNATATAAERAEAARQLILTAACEVIAEVGLESVRMRMVAERAGVSTALLHYHFANRETLFLAALRYSYLVAGSKDYADSPPEGSANPDAWRLAHAIELCLPVTPELRRDFLLWQELGLRAARDASSGAAAAELYRELAEWLAAIIADGIVAGHFRADADPGPVVDLMISLTQGYGLALLLPEPPYPADQARDAIWAALREPLGLDPERPVVELRARLTPAGLQAWTAGVRGDGSPR